MKDSVENLQGKLSREELSTIDETLRDNLDWLEYNENASKEDFEYHLKEMQKVIDPLVSKIYGKRKPKDDQQEEDDDEVITDL
mmetsp:Transcript_35982/g.26727  ORF Transcript_35982/g.26727 Transcript_35982/m.26727 type:complete len:83 (-) Transcript_35982:26-274(-)